MEDSLGFLNLCVRKLRKDRNLFNFIFKVPSAQLIKERSGLSIKEIGLESGRLVVVLEDASAD